MSSVKLSVIIPAYNAAKDITRGVLDEVNNYLSKQDYTYEVLVVDDGSSDTTAQEVEKAIGGKKGFQLIKNPHKGKAVTVITGLLKSQGEIAVFTDVDQSTPLAEISKFLPKFNQGYDIVIGSRTGRKGAPFFRKIIALGFAILRGIMLGLPFKDTQCGFKAFNRKVIEEVFPTVLKRYENAQVSGRALNADFDVEFLYIARKKHFKIAEVGVDWHDANPANANLIKNALDTIKGMFQIRINDFQGKYV